MRRTALAVGDAAALSSFAVIGVKSHGGRLTPASVARNAAPVVGGWFAASALVGTYRQPGLSSAVRAWAVGVPAGVLARQLILRRHLGRETVQFGSITMATTLTLLLAWRAMAAKLGARAER